MESPIKYAKSGDVHIAYRVFGQGPHDIVLIPGTISHVELFWELPANQYMLQRLASFARVIVFDKRGQGLSDRVGEQTLEERIGDVLAVMDAVGSERATIYGWSEGGAMSLLFAATYPQRTASLVVFGSYATMRAAPWSVQPDAFGGFLEILEAKWGQGVLVALNAPSRAKDEAFVQWWARLERASASPGALLALFRANYEIDVRDILPSIHVPTLVIHRVGDALVPVDCGRHLARQIPGAKYVEVPGHDHMIQSMDQELLDGVLDEIEEFITGTRRRPEPDRTLATLMFVDVVGSTEHAVSLGDRRWREKLQGLFAVIRRELTAFRGREVKTTGDGVLATFDGPARAIRSACAIRERVRPLGLRVRAGVHTGECEILGDDLGGIAVHIAARVAAAAGADEVLVSSTVKDLVAGSQMTFVDRGAHELKGVPGKWRLHAVA
jgi:pimeloyl-ACP methyl ester carboxylesterase/class 3 adenylate cyclase